MKYRFVVLVLGISFFGFCQNSVSYIKVNGVLNDMNEEISVLGTSQVEIKLSAKVDSIYIVSRNCAQNKSKGQKVQGISKPVTIMISEKKLTLINASLLFNFSPNELGIDCTRIRFFIVLKSKNKVEQKILFYING